MDKEWNALSDFPPSNSKTPGFVNSILSLKKMKYVTLRASEISKTWLLIHLCFEDDGIWRP